MKTISAIYRSVRHHLHDDWAYGNDLDAKPWDFQQQVRHHHSQVHYKYISLTLASFPAYYKASVFSLIPRSITRLLVCIPHFTFMQDGLSIFTFYGKTLFGLFGCVGAVSQNVLMIKFIKCSVMGILAGKVYISIRIKECLYRIHVCFGEGGAQLILVVQPSLEPQGNSIQ